MPRWNPNYQFVDFVTKVLGERFGLDAIIWENEETGEKKSLRDLLQYVRDGTPYGRRLYQALYRDHYSAFRQSEDAWKPDALFINFLADHLRSKDLLDEPVIGNPRRPMSKEQALTEISRATDIGIAIYDALIKNPRLASLFEKYKARR